MDQCYVIGFLRPVFTVLDNPHKRTDADLVDKITGYLDTDTVLFPVEVRVKGSRGAQGVPMWLLAQDWHEVVTKVSGM